MEENNTGLSHPTVWVGVITLTLVSLYFVKLIWWLALPFLMAGIFYYIHPLYQPLHHPLHQPLHPL